MDAIDVGEAFKEVLSQLPTRTQPDAGTGYRMPDSRALGEMLLKELEYRQLRVERAPVG